MRIAVLSPLAESVPPRLYGGTERVVSNLCRGLVAAKMEVVLFASGDSIIDGKVVPIVDQALRLKGLSLGDANAYNMKMLATVARQADDFDIIHNHNDYWMLPLSAMTKTPILTTTHGRMDLKDQPAAFLAFPNVSYVSISDAQRYPLPQLRWIQTIYHGLDVETFQFYEKPGQYLAFLGRISAEKRPEWAIEVAQRSGVPLKIAAKIEGRRGQAYYDTYVRPHVDGKFIEYLGEISESEKSEFLGNALALIFPIDWPEPFGLVMIEALACGTPVLARPCGSVPELLRDGVTGFVHSSVEQLAERVKDLSGISRKKCREWVETRFSLQRMAEEYIHVFRQLSAKRFKSDNHRWNFLHPVQRTADGNF